MKLLLLLSAICLLASCGYQEPEGDKYPDLPLFPEHTNQNIEVEAFPYEGFKNAQTKGKYIYVYCKEDSLELLVIYDRQFQEVKRIESPRKSAIDESGVVYVIENDNIDDRSIAYNYSPPLFKRKKVKVKSSGWTGSSTDSLTRIYTDALDRREQNNPSFEAQYFIDSIQREMVRTTILPDLTCVFRLNKDEYILNYESESYYLYTTKNLTDMGASFCPKAETYEGERFEAFDDAVLGNHSHGNHYTFGYSPYGYEYVNLVIDSDTTSFKVRDDNGSSNLAKLGSRGKDIVVSYAKQWYWVRLK